MTDVLEETTRTVGTKLAGLHPLIRALPGMLDIDERERRLRRTMAFRDEVFRKATERYERAEARYKERCAEADEALKPRPERKHKGPPDVDERRREVESFRNQRDALDNERMAIIAEHADTITAQLLDLEADALSKAAEAVAVLDSVVPVLEELRETQRRANLAANRAVRTGGGSIGALDVINAVRSDNSFLAPKPVRHEIVDLGNGMRYTKRVRTGPDEDAESGEPEFVKQLEVHYNPPLAAQTASDDEG